MYIIIIVIVWAIKKRKFQRNIHKQMDDFFKYMHLLKRTKEGYAGFVDVKI